MKTRSILLLSISSLWLLAADAPPRTFRPAEAGALDRAAGTVLFTKGPAKVLAAGRAFEAKEGFSLGRSDEIAVDLGGVAVVELANGYLVRIDEEISLPVGDILLLDAVPPRDSLDQQLQRLFAGAERKQLPERIVGFHARVAAAESLGAQTSSQRSALTAKAAAPARSAPAPQAFAPPPPAPSAAAAPELAKSAPRFEAKARAKADSAPPSRGLAARELNVSADESAAAEIALPPMEKEAEEARARKWALRRAGTVEARGDELPEPLRSALAARALPYCLASAVRGLEHRPGSLQLMVQVREGTISKVALGRGLPLPPSCAAMLAGKSLLLEGLDGPAWLLVEVPLR